MDQFDSRHIIPGRIIPVPPPNPFIDSSFPLFFIDNLDEISHQDRLSITTFIQAYNNDPSQYGDKEPIDLVGENMSQHFEIALALAASMGSIDFYQFILDTGLVGGEISNNQFIRGCFDQGKELSYTFTKYLLDLCPNRINLIPPNITLCLFAAQYWSMSMSSDILQLFWDYCPQLKDPNNFLNSKIRFPNPKEHSDLIDLTIRCLDDGGYNGDLSLYELEERYGSYFLRDEMYPITFIMFWTPIPLIQSFIENTQTSLTQLYRLINSRLTTQKDLRSLENIPREIRSILCEPMYRSHTVLSSKDVLWYLNWWKNDVLGDVMSLHEFKIAIFNSFPTFHSPNAFLCVEYLDTDFSATLSSRQVFTFFDNIIRNPFISTITFPLLKALLSIPSLANNIKHHCVHFTRKALLSPTFLWDCAKLFLKIGGLTMEHIWSDDSNTNNNDKTKEIFTLRTIFPSLGTKALRIPIHFIKWLSDQPGTQGQLIKLVQSKQQCTNEPKPFDLLFGFMYLSCHQQRQWQRLVPEEQEHLNLFPSLSIPWLQTLIVNTPIDYMTTKFTITLWRSHIRDLGIIDTIVGNETSIWLSHFPILLEEDNEDQDDYGPAVVLEDIIQGVIASISINHQ